MRSARHLAILEQLQAVWGQFYAKMTEALPRYKRDQEHCCFHVL